MSIDELAITVTNVREWPLLSTAYGRPVYIGENTHHDTIAFIAYQNCWGGVTKVREEHLAKHYDVAEERTFSIGREE